MLYFSELNSDPLSCAARSQMKKPTDGCEAGAAVAAAEEDENDDDPVDCTTTGTLLTS